uniref:Uncharacterized protein n=1 Tax=Avena sativa TaxID=4498 RepID=A0ACD5U4K3_AVESA
MKAMILRRRGSGGGLRIKRKGRGFMCGCGGSKAVSISDGSDKQSPMATPPTNTSTATTTTTTTMSTATTDTAKGTWRAGNSKSASMVSTAAAPSSSFSPSSADDADTSVGSTPSVAALLRQLGELERTVRSLQDATAENVGGRRHRRTSSEGGGGAGARRIEESVAVVKESADPLADFRRSMLQMIVEKEIVGGDELRELLHRFLSLNAPHHHHLILRAFAEIWEEVFSGYERTPDFLVSHSHSHGKRRLQREPVTTVSSIR